MPELTCTSSPLALNKRKDCVELTRASFRILSSISSVELEVYQDSSCGMAPGTVMVTVTMLFWECGAGCGGGGGGGPPPFPAIPTLTAAKNLASHQTSTPLSSASCACSEPYSGTTTMSASA